MTTVATSDNIWATVARDEVAAAARSPPPDCGHYIGSPQPGSASSTPRPGKGDGKAGPLPPAMSLPADWCAASDDDEDEATDAGRRHKAAALATAVLLSCADGTGADDDDNAVVSARRSAAKTASARSAAADELSEYAAHDDSRSTATAEHHADPEEEEAVKGWANHAGLRAEAAAARGSGYHHKATPILVPGPASWEDGDDGSDESAEEDDGDYDFEDEEAPEEDGGDAPFAGGATMKRQYSASFHVTAGGDADGDDAIEEEVEEEELLSSSPGSADRRCRALAADDDDAEVAEERCETPLDLEAQRQQIEWEKSQALAEYCTRMTAAQVVSENDQRVSLAILMREAHRHHRRAAFKSGAMTGGVSGKPKFPIVGSVARPPFTTDFQWRQIAGNAMEDFELNGHASVQRMLSCMCIFSPASSARDYGDHEDARIGRATRQRQKLIQLQMQAARGGSGLFLEPESF